MKIAFVLWDGLIGGAERFTASLAAEVRNQGTDATVIFVGKGHPLSMQLEADSVPFDALGFSRGFHVLRRPRTLGRVMRGRGADVAVIGGFGYLGALLRIGGFRGPILGVEHGVLHQLPAMPRRRRVLRLIDRALGAATHDVEIAVSRYMETLAGDTVHGRRLVRISHGVASPPSSLKDHRRMHQEFTVGYAGRLCAGKGLEILLRAIAVSNTRHGSPRLRVHIVGDGPARPSLEHLAYELKIASHVAFLGWSDDIAGFWAGCDIAVTPAAELPESFSMSTLEAMASGRATIVTDRGALPELVIPGETGMVVPAGSAIALADAIDAYASSPDLATSHGFAAQTLVRRRFTLERCAQSYILLATELVEGRPPRSLHANDGDGESGLGQVGASHAPRWLRDKYSPMACEIEGGGVRSQADVPSAIGTDDVRRAQLPESRTWRRP
jgi:glycosyltransferase involved in cell wall biosynthesis